MKNAKPQYERYVILLKHTQTMQKLSHAPFVSHFVHINFTQCIYQMEGETTQVAPQSAVYKHTMSHRAEVRVGVS